MLSVKDPIQTSYSYFQVLSIFVMGTVSITDSITVSFFSNYMSHQYDIPESKSGWIMTVASVFYTAATFASGVIGLSKKVFNLYF